MQPTTDNIAIVPLWLAAEDEAARIERQAGWHWAWTAENPTATPAPSVGPPAPRPFLWSFCLSEPLQEARLLIAAQKGLPGVWIDGQLLHASHDGLAGRELQDLALGDLAAGRHRLAVEVRTFHPFIQEPRQGGVAALLRGRDARGQIVHLAPLASAWRSTMQAEPGWPGQDRPAGDWQPAAAPVEPIDWLPSPAQPARLMRRAFELSDRPVQARLEITALGGYEAEINGHPVGDACLAPENSDFRHRLLVQQHDVTALLRPGENVLGATVADGFYASEAIGRGRYPFGAAPRRLWARLTLTFEGGSQTQVLTDAHWRAAPSPVRFSEIYHGETHDARLEQPGWSTPGFDDRHWDPVGLAEPPACALMPQESPPIRITRRLKPRQITRLGCGEFVVDFGQNFAGVCAIRVRGPAGHAVVMRHAEILGADGQVDMRNLRAALATDRYILRGDPAGETWRPRFTYHGLRYLQLSGWPGEMEDGDVEGLVMHTDLPETGEFDSSEPLLQALWSNTFWSQRSNFVGVPTDCPQRDERLGWTGDAQIFWPTAAFNMDVRSFTRRFLADMRASQRADGAYADTNPPALPAYGAPGWSDAGVVLPHTVWQHYGETALIDEHWASMTRWMHWIAEANPDGLWRHRREVDFGDWLSLDAVSLMDETTPKLLTATACWGRMLGMMAEMAAATGRTDAELHYRSAQERVRAAFLHEFVDGQGRIGNESHTGYILPLAFGLLPPALRQKAADRLAAGIRARGTLLTTGFLGTPFSLDALAMHGHADLAVELLLRTEYPGWGYMVSRGATTIWERWNGDTGDVAMNSFNHYALGAVTGFLYRRVAGLQSASPGWRTLRLAPLLDARLGAGRCRHDTVQGTVSSAWGQDVQQGRWYEISLPSGCTATLELPWRAGQPALALSGDGRPRRFTEQDAG